jgi:hypothetical protein
LILLIEMFCFLAYYGRCCTLAKINSKMCQQRMSNTSCINNKIARHAITNRDILKLRGGYSVTNNCMKKRNKWEKITTTRAFMKSVWNVPKLRHFCSCSTGCNYFESKAFYLWKNTVCHILM